MADVARLRETDRGQLFLVGAFALAVIFVSLAVLLNTAIYSGNVATRDTGPGTAEIVEYEHAVDEMAVRALTDVNTGNNSGYDDLETTFGNTVSIWSERANVHSSAELADAHVSVVATTQGTKIGQDTNRNFTDDNENATWTVANDTQARSFRMNVSQNALNSLTAGFGLSEVFSVQFVGDSGTWDVYVTSEGTDNVVVDVYDPSDTQVGSSCTADAGADGYTVVDFSQATVGPVDCQPLETMANELSTQYDIRYVNTVVSGSQRVYGTYELVVDRRFDELETGADETANEPYATPVLYSAELQITYRSSVTYYQTNVSIAPEELDA